MNRSRVYNLAQAKHSDECLPMTFGRAVLPYCETNKCWLLPAGPNQEQRQVRDPAAALKFAQQLHVLMCRIAA